MKLVIKYRAVALAAVGGLILLFAASARAQEKPDDKDFIRLRTPLRFDPFSSGMTAIDPPSTEKQPTEGRGDNDQPPATPSQPQRTLQGYETTLRGTLQRFSDGSTLELRPECSIETLCTGTKIEKLPEGTTIVRWPNGAGVIRYPDGTGADFRPDPREPSRSGDLSPTQGTIELLPGGVVRQTLKDDGVVLDRYPDGTVRSRPDLVKPEAKTGTPMAKPVGKDLSVLPLNPFSKKLDAPKALIPIIKPSIKSGVGRE